MDRDPVDYRAADRQQDGGHLDPEVTPPIRFRRPEELQDYLENTDKEELLFSAIPISGEPETFRYNSQEKVVIRTGDGALFDSVADFICYGLPVRPGGVPPHRIRGCGIRISCRSGGLHNICIKENGCGKPLKEER